MGRIFKNFTEAINEIERDIMEMGIRVHPNSMQNKDVTGNEDFSTLEVQNYSFTILDTSDKFSDCLSWCHAEFKERISLDTINPGEAWKLREEVWKEFLNEYEEFDYSYNERIASQLPLVIKELSINPDTRQAIIDIHYPTDAWNMQKLRIPCSMYYQLMLRRGKLDIIYNMRSSDFDTHFKNDIWLASELRDYIAKEIGKPAGLFHMNIGSLHRYKNYTKKIVF
jgi:thymidylate synthase